MWGRCKSQHLQGLHKCCRIRMVMRKSLEGLNMKETGDCRKCLVGVQGPSRMGLGRLGGCRMCLVRGLSKRVQEKNKKAQEKNKKVRGRLRGFRRSLDFVRGLSMMELGPNMMELGRSRCPD